MQGQKRSEIKIKRWNGEEQQNSKEICEYLVKSGRLQVSTVAGHMQPCTDQVVCASTVPCSAGRTSGCSPVSEGNGVVVPQQRCIVNAGSCL